MKEQDNRRYPIGQFEYDRKYSFEDTRKHIKELGKFPKELKKAVKKLRGGDLDKPYRAGGWSIRQVIHHIADSHMNAYVRLKLAVTENTPIIKPYEEQLWAETEDGQHAPIKMSLKIISALHTRWVAFLESLSEEDLERGYYHPDAKRTILIQEAIALYVWHSQHHLHHIRLATDGKTKPEAPMPSADALTVLEDPQEPKRRGPKPKAKPAVVADAAPKKRGMTEEHKAKIRAAHEARRIAKGGGATPVAPAPTEGKRTRRTKEQMAADRANVPVATERRKPGPKPKAAAVESAASAPTTAKRTRRTKEQMAADRAAAAASPVITERRKPGRPAQPKAEKPANTEPKKRGMSPEHMAKIREARMAKRAEAIAAGVITPKPKKEKAAVAETGDAPKKRGMSPEHMAKIREARMAKRAEAISSGIVTAKPKKEKAAKAVATDNGDAPKKRGMSPEHMAKIREARMAKRAAAADSGDTTATVVAKPKKEKAAKAVATDNGDAPKKRGMSPEHMAKIREARMAKRAAAAESGDTTATVAAKPKKEKAAKAVAADSGDAPKKRGMSPEHMAKIREARMAKRAAAADGGATTSTPTAKPKKEKAAKAVAADSGDAPKKRGMSPEHMAKIREARMAKRAAAAEGADNTATVTAKPKKEKAPKAVAAETGDAPKKRGMSPEHMAKIREARMAKRAESNATANITAKPKKEKATNEDGTPKKRGMSAEHMAKIREARMAKIAEKKSQQN